MTDPLNNALLDVRRAYRLLADYQQRMFELLGYIRDRLGAKDYHQAYVHSLPQSVAGLENRTASGLRYLPFYDLSVIWLRCPQNQADKPHTHLKGDLMFGAWVRSDTGYNKYTGQFSDTPVVATESELLISVVICDVPAPGNWYWNVWSAISYPADGEVNDQDKPGYRCFAKAVPLAQLADKVAIDSALHRWCLEASQKLDAEITLHPVHS
ncbi:hypothetical protein N5I28_08075 [Pseudomonas mosselii]|uniref:DUF985 domain-containing protein n=1 Tax=Pseudomonas mosselii TaxID=78327 RepID=A0ABX9AZB5_9PSED|nr:hypothetical protein [Pseudomonas mosselii]MCL8300166.1 hypothetical protein [Pseudomonas mosselii]MCL8338920.1 hypothetical protein [Pseudomonas mosselii]MDH1509710.1 hypothetical protein [Pseudomonas mosselii]QZP26418.1 hypothetical protein K5H97_27200 [Pseudomonas mosselii]WJR28099.1 hypothetical protein LU678_027800 [Pseudomonas mosselii]